MIMLVQIKEEIIIFNHFIFIIVENCPKWNIEEVSLFIYDFVFQIFSDKLVWDLMDYLLTFMLVISQLR